MEFLECLTRSHAIRVESQVGVEECSLAIGEVVGHERVLSGSPMNKAIGFGPGFRAMIETMYRDIESVLKINGALSAPFKVSRGIRQGCAMSGMLYSLAIEPLLHKLRTELEGLSLPHCNSKRCLSAYAHDLVVVVNGNEDIDKLFSIAKCC